MPTMLERYFAELETYKTREDILNSQKKNFENLIKYALVNSPYYKKKFNDAGINLSNYQDKDITEFPTTDKKSIIKHFSEVVTADDLDQNALESFDENNQLNKLFKDKYHIIHSSGSTGKPNYFVYGQDDWQRMLLGMFRGALWGMDKQELLNFVSKKPRVLYLAAIDGRYGGMMGVSQALQNIGAQALYLNINSPLDEMISKTCQFNPDAIIGYPTAIKILTEGLKKQGKSLNLSRIVTAGEPLSPGLRKYLENEYQIPIINYYGASESLALGVEVGDGNGMYLFDDLNIIERYGNKILLTNLYNFTQPLIRYELTDELNFSTCSNSLFTTSDVLQSRSEDVMWFKDEDRIEFLHPLAVEGFQIKGLIDYQFVQTSEKSFNLLLEVDDPKNKDRIKHQLLPHLKQILVENHLNFITFKILFEQIEPEQKSGKKRLMVPLKEMIL